MTNIRKQIFDDKYRKLLVDSLLRKAEADIQAKKDEKIRQLEIENAVLKSKLQK